MTQVKHFIIDFCKQILYFCLHPMQYLFFKMPRAYEIIVCLLLWVKSFVPTRQELHYTWIHWQFILACISQRMLLHLVNQSLNLSKMLQSKLLIIAEAYQTHRNNSYNN